MSQNNQLVSKALEIQQNTLENSQKALADAVELPMKQSIELQKNAAKLFLDGLEMTNDVQNRNTELTRDAFTSYIDSVEDTVQDTTGLAGQQPPQQPLSGQYQTAGQQPGQPQQYQQTQRYQQPPQQYRQPSQQFQPPQQQPQTAGQQPQTAAQQPQQAQPQSAPQRPPAQPPAQAMPSRQQPQPPASQHQQPPTSQYTSQQYGQQPQQSGTVQGQTPSMGFQTGFSTQTRQPAEQQSTTQPPRQPMTAPPGRQEETDQNLSRGGTERASERTEEPAENA